MEQSRKESETAHNVVNTDDAKLTCLLFEDRASSKIAINELNKYGHTTKDFNVLTKEDLLNQSCLVRGEAIDTDKEFMRKAVNGIKKGALIGIVFAGILIIISNLNNQTELSVNLILGIIVGVVAGAILGFLLAPLLPFKTHKMYVRKLIKQNILIRFQKKSQTEKNYLKQMNWTICQIGLQ
jgi:tetrahydromethanopterin S-methyltransferase subunit F